MNRSELRLSPERIAALGIPVPPGMGRERAPELRPGITREFGPTDEGHTDWWGCESTRVTLAGGNLVSEILHPSILAWERLYRRLPEEGMFSSAVSAQTPFVGELGAFTVPGTMALLVFQLRPDIYRFSGIDPGDFVPVEARRFASIMGFEVTVDNQHIGNLDFQIDPVAFQTQMEAFTSKAQQQAPGQQQPYSANSATPGTVSQAAPPQPPQSVFNIASSQSFGNVAGVGHSLLPQRPTRYGALGTPFMLIAGPGQTVRSRIIVFRPVPSPIAFIEYDMAGYLVPDIWLQAILKCAKPVMDKLR